MGAVPQDPVGWMLMDGEREFWAGVPSGREVVVEVCVPVGEGGAGTQRTDGGRVSGSATRAVVSGVVEGDTPGWGVVGVDVWLRGRSSRVEHPMVEGAW